MVFLRGDFHQGDAIFPETSIGRQCVPNCLMFLAWLKMKPLIRSWVKEDVNHILLCGDDLYRQIKGRKQISYDYLLVSDLPRSFSLGKSEIFLLSQGQGPVTEYSGFLKKDLYYISDLNLSLEFALNLLFNSNNSDRNCILILCHSAIAVCKRNQGFVVFDPHNRDSEGLCSHRGSSHVSIYETLQCFCRYIRDLAMSLTQSPLEQVQFDIQPLSLTRTGKSSQSTYVITPGQFFQMAHTSLNTDLNTNSNKRKSSDHACTASKRQKTQNVLNLTNKLRSIDNIVVKFKNSVTDGPLYVCTSCSQTWFREAVTPASRLKPCPLRTKCTSGIVSQDNIEWVCLTCKKHLENNKIPECSVGNGMKFIPVPPQLQNLTELEERLISPRIPFMAIREQPRGGQYCMKGNVVNVPADVCKTVQKLPRTLSESETIHVKLKRKLAFKHCVVSEMVRPNVVVNAVKYLVDRPLFRSEGIKVNEDWSVEHALYCPDEHIVDPNYEQASQRVRSENNNTSDSDNWDEGSILQNRLSGNLDTLLMPVDFREFSSVLCLAPCEGNIPLGLFQDINSEFLSFPTIYCGHARQPNNERAVPVHYSTIAKWELRHVDRRVAMCIPNIFFKLKKVQIKFLKDRVQLAIRKCKLSGKKMTVHDILAPGAICDLVRRNEGFQVLRNLRGSPAYWEAAKKDVFALIRQLGIPTFFVSLSAAETKWVNLLQTLGKLVDKTEYSSAQINNMCWQEKCRLIKTDPVTCARYFDYRVQKFLKEILMDNTVKPLGELTDFFYRVEFQQRGSPHIHMLLWIKHAPGLAKHGVDTVVKFIDEHVVCKNDSDMTDLVAYQMHRHARTCRKKGKPVCRFNFPIPPMSKTMILFPLKQDMEQDSNTVLKKDCDKIFHKLEEMKTGSDISFGEFLQELNMTESRYIKAIRYSLRKETVFLKRNPSEIRINCYNALMLKCWSANLDVQFILNAYSCAAYIVSYISKGQRGLSNLLYRAAKEAREQELDFKQQIRHVGNKFLTHVEIGAQEAVYLLLQMPLRRASRKVEFVNTNPPEKRVTLLKTVSDLEEMSADSTNIEADNTIKRYSRRPMKLENICLADFVSWFEVSYPRRKTAGRSSKTACELAEIHYDDNLDDDPYVDSNKHCEKDTLEYVMVDGGVLRKRKTQKIIRYVRFNKYMDPDNHYRELLMLFHPWRNEVADIPDTLQGILDAYEKNKNEIDIKRAMYEKQREVLDEIESYHDETGSNNDTYAQLGLESEHANQQAESEGQSLAAKYGCFNPGKANTYDVGKDIGCARKQIEDEGPPHKLADTEYRHLVQMLNEEQKIYFYHIMHWFKNNTEPLYNFLSGGAGVGKSVLTRAIYQALIRCLNLTPGSNPDDIKVLMVAPTGKAAHNIQGNTIHSTFCIPANRGFAYKPLDMEQLNIYRVKYSALKVILIDEISMVGCKMFNFINLRLQEIMGTQKIFGGVSVIAIGDLFQLKPVMDNWIFSPFANEYGYLASNLWQDHFTLYELHKIMRQKDDHFFAKLLNRLREGLHTDDDICALKSKQVSETNEMQQLPHLYTTRKMVENFNDLVFESCTQKTATISAIDTVSGELSNVLAAKIIEKIPHDSSKTMGLPTVVKIAEKLQAEISLNVNVEDGLTNGTPCLIKHLDYRVQNSDRCSIVWVLFEDVNIGKEQRHSFKHLFTSNIHPSWTPILEISRKLSVSSNHGYQVIRRQFPIHLTAAKTIHKAQGSTLQTVVLDFGDRKNPHMHYVGLSRVTKLSGLHIVNLNESKISVCPQVLAEMDRLRCHNPVQICLPILTFEQRNFNIVFHNTRSLHLHYPDLKNETILTSADVVAVVESRLTSTDSSEEYALPGFSMLRHDSISVSKHRLYYGTAVYSKIPVAFISMFCYRGMEVTALELHGESLNLSLIVVYCPPKFACLSNFKLLFHELQSLSLLTGNTIVIGDFNIDILQHKSLELFMSSHSFIQHISEATTDSCTALDHIYTNIQLPGIQTGVLESYYSDHKPIFISIPL